MATLASSGGTRDVGRLNTSLLPEVPVAGTVDAVKPLHAQ
jgi:hypothetical protein